MGNATASGYDPVEELHDLGDRIAQVHFKDRTADGETVMLGAWAVDFEGCVEALEDIDSDDWVVLETASPGDLIEDAATNLAVARAVLEKS